MDFNGSVITHKWCTQSNIFLVVHECFNQLHSLKKNLTMWIGVGKLINSLATQVIKGDEKRKKTKKKTSKQDFMRFGRNLSLYPHRVFTFIMRVIHKYKIPSCTQVHYSSLYPIHTSSYPINWPKTWPQSKSWFCHIPIMALRYVFLEQRSIVFHKSSWTRFMKPKYFDKMQCFLGVPARHVKVKDTLQYPCLRHIYVLQKSN